MGSLGVSLAGCSSSRPSPQQKSISGPLAVAILSAIGAGGEATSYLSIVDEKVAASAVRVEALADSQPTLNRAGTVVFSGPDAIFATANGRTRQWDIPHQTVQHWVGLRQNGDTVSVYNSGFGEAGYVTDVFWPGSGTELRHTVIPDVPGGTGLAGDALWMLNAGSATSAGNVSLYRADLRTGGTMMHAKWRHWQPGGELAASFEGSSDLFAVGHYLYFLEYYSAINKKGRYVRFSDDGNRTHVRLGAFDLSTGHYSSRPVAQYLHGAFETATETVPAAAATRGAYCDGKAIYFVDLQGRIFRVEVTLGRIHLLGQLSSDARVALDAAAAWTDRGLSLLTLKDGSGRAVWETYSLASGQLVRSVDVSAGLSRTEKDGLRLSGFAVQSI